MKKRILGILTVVLALSMAFTMVSCGEKGGDDDPEVTGVTVTPATATVSPGGTEQFSAKVTVKGGAKTAVTWSVEGSVANASDIDNDGLLSVGVNEAATTLTVKATSEFDSKKFGTATVTVGTSSGTTFTITYDANGWTGNGVPTASKQVSAGPIGAADLPDLADTDTQIFGGWATSADGTPIASHYEVTGDITLYVIWEPVVAAGGEITIKYDANGWTGTGVPTADGTGESGKALTAAELPDLTDTETQTFVGWATTPGGSAIDTTFVPKSNITLYVIWTPVGGISTVTITFDVNWPAGAGGTPPVVAAIDVEEDMEVGTLPTPSAAPEDFVFGGWWNAAGSIKYDENSRFVVNTTLYARWVPTTLTGEDADELLYLQNGGYAFYKFEIPAGSTLANYEKLSVDFKISAAGLQIWSDKGIRGVRLYGVFTPEDVDKVKSGSNEQLFGLPDVKIIDINSYNTPYRITNPGAGSGTSTTASDIIHRVVANDWFTVEHSLAGDGNAENVPNAPGAQTGTVYFALGLSCQTTNAGKDRGDAFIQLVKDVKLIHKTEDSVVAGVKPGDDFAEFLAYNDPIVFEWRGEPTAENIENPPLPEVIEIPFDRGEPPVAADLVAVDLGSFTYINRNNPTNQAGWASFGEAGRANDQSYAGAPSSVAFGNFTKAWYLVLETEATFTGGASLIWMGGAGGWNSNAITTNAGEPNVGLEITPVGDDPEDPEGYIIKLFLPDALAQYQRYFEENTEWATFCIQYWGASGANLETLNISKAYLLVDKEEVEGNATGIAVEISFELGTAPAGGAVIDDVILNSAGKLVVTAAVGLTDYRWYVDGVSATGSINLVIEVIDSKDCVVTLQAKRGGKWVSQAVTITVKS